MSKFSWMCFGNPTNKTVTGSIYTWGILIANHLDQSLWSTNQKKILSRSQVQFITLCFGGAQLCCAIYQPGQDAWIWCRKPKSWAKPAHFDFFALNCTVWSHILSTGGDALEWRDTKLWPISLWVNHNVSTLKSRANKK